MPRLAILISFLLSLTACVPAIDGGESFAAPQTGVALLERYCLAFGDNLAAAEAALISAGARKSYDKTGRYGRTTEYYFDTQKVGIELRFTKVPRCQSRFITRADPVTLRATLDALPNYAPVPGATTRMVYPGSNKVYSLTSTYAHVSGQYAFVVTDGYGARGNLGNGVKLQIKR